jgi:plasmid maintenance system killer protein
MVSKKTVITGKSFSPTRWVSCELADSDKRHLKTLEVDWSTIMGSIERLISDGYRLSLGYEEKNDCVGVYLTAPKDTVPGFSVSLSARGPDVQRALLVLNYKHFEMLGGDWSGKVDTRGEIDPWG